VFIPTTRDYKIGDDVYVLLTLPEDPQRYPVAGKVAWVTPPAPPPTAPRASACASRPTRSPSC
jgi:Tfp pilus assembly protein PilZ